MDAKVAQLLETLRGLALVSSAVFDGVAAWEGTAYALCQHLVGLGALTPFQVERLIRGKADDLPVGPYRILGRLGAGGMGEVFLARHVETGALVAVKVLHPRRVDHPDAARRFEREARAAISMDHPHVVRAREFGRHGATLYLVLEYVEGIDLGRLVKEAGPLAIAEACEAARQACLALEHARERGLVHRDVKPSNLLRCSDGTVKLLDLGLALIDPLSEAASESSLTETGVVMGTPDYLAPEQIKSAHDVDTRADLYALGCTLYHLLAGRPPFAGLSLAEKLVQHRTGRPADLATLRERISPELAAFVARLMAKEPGDRYQTPREAAEALESLQKAGLCGEFDPYSRLESSSLSLTERIGRWKRGGMSKRAVAKAVAAGASVLTGALLLGWWIVRSASPPPVPPPKGAELSPLDALSVDGIAPEFRVPWLPHGTVAVFGDPKGGLGSSLDAVAWSPDGKRIAVGGENHMVSLHDPETLAPLAAESTERTVRGLGFTPDSNSLLVSTWLSDPPSFRLRLDNGKRETLPFEADRFAPDGGAGLSSYLGTLTLFRAGGGGRLSWEYEQAERASGTGLRFSADGTRFAGPGAKAGDVVVRDAKNGAVLASHPAALGSEPGALAFLAGGQLLAADKKGAIRVLGSGPVAPKREMHHGSGVRDLAVLHGGQRFVSANRYEVRLWDLARGETVRRLGEDRTPANVVAASPKGDRFVAATARGQLRLWSSDGAELARYGERPVVLSRVTLAPAGDRLLTGDVEGVVRLYDVRSGATVWEEKQAGSVAGLAFSPDGSRFVQLHEPAAVHCARLDRIPLEVIRPPLDRVKAVAWDPAGKLVWCAGGKGKAEDGKSRPANPIIAYDPDTGREAARLEGHPTDVRSIALSPDGKRLVSAAQATEKEDALVKVKVWDLSTNRLARELDTGKGMLTLPLVAVSRNGRWVAAMDRVGHLFVWDLEQAGEQPAYSGRVAGELPFALAFTPDSRRIVCTSGPGDLGFYSLTGTRLGRIHLPGGPRDVAFSRDGRHIVVANTNGTAAIIRLAKELSSPIPLGR